MTRVEIVDSLKYGGKMFAYFLGVVVLGGGGVALGAAIGWDSASVRGTGGDPIVHDTPELVAGIVLVAIGGAMLFTGLFGVVHKLLADSITEGIANRPSSPTAGSTGGTGAPSDEERVQRHGGGTTGPAAAESEPEDKPMMAPADTAGADRDQSGEQGTTGTAQDRTASPASDRERTAEEIAFGTGQRPDDESAPETTADVAASDDPADDETRVPEYDDLADGGSTATSTTDDDPLGD